MGTPMEWLSPITRDTVGLLSPAIISARASPAETSPPIVLITNKTPSISSLFSIDTSLGIIYAEKFGKMAYITKCTTQLMRDLGSIPSPNNCFLLNLGLETLHLRMPRHCANALAVAKYLENNEKVEWVNYPDLEGDKYHDRQLKYLPNGSCGVVTFGLKGGRDVAIKFMDNLKLAAIVTHVADSRTSVLHPASHTHRQLTDEQLKAAGVNPDLIRFSVGTENVEDIIADIEQALKAATV